MATIEERYQMIETEIMEDAQAKADKLRAQAEEYRQSALKKAEDEVLHELYSKIQDEISEIRGSTTRSVSQQEAQSRQSLLLKREELTNSVFLHVRKMLLEYTKTPAYQKFMLDLAKEMAKIYPLENSTIMLKADDYSMASQLDEVFGKKCRILADENIHIGGMKLMNQGAGIFVDETLDSRLEDQKPWFYSHSGLSIT
ncbi:V-type ATP synthase subunit E [Angelakisella massiliensis]|uniref:V-type ATP synthase subunit E n=1 Tax=Angelakisella massiliensis TaxID=1871018 RepID=UPI0008F8AB48|nr:V-type ATP synthase subunit E family protein [Angelakisella massiliensis]